MTQQTELEKDIKVFGKTFDKNKLINLFKTGLPKYFMPIEDTPYILKEDGDVSFKKFFSKEYVSVHLNLSLGWKLHKKVFIIPPDVLTGFLDIGNELEYEREKDLIFPASILDSFPYWSNFVKVERKISLNIITENEGKEDQLSMNIKMNNVLYGIREYNGKLKLYFIVYYTRYIDTEEVKENLTHYFDILSTDSINVLTLHYNVSECESPMRGLLQMFLPILFNITMYVGTMNKHNPTPYKQADISLKRLGNKFVLPNPSLKEVPIGDHVTRIINSENTKKGGKSRLKTHLRKGYWRRQWYGPKNKPEERKIDLIFIPPCIVRGFNE